MRSQILYISGHAGDAPILSQMLQSLPLILDHVDTLQQARTRLFQQRYDAVLTQSSLPDGNWLDVLHIVRDSPFETHLIVTDLHADARLWSEVLNYGGYDLLAQPFYGPEVRRILSNACEEREAPVLAAF